MTNKELSLKTRRSLAAALKKAMENKKLSKITVSELCAACDVNRKTFYYHFADIYALLKWMLEQEAVEVVKNFDFIIDTEEAIRFVMDYVDQNKHIINGAFDSMGFEEIKRFFHNDLFSVIYGAIEQGEEELSVHVEPQFKKFLASFYTEAAAGLLIEWTKKRGSQDKEMTLQNLVFIFKTSIPVMLQSEKISLSQHSPE